MPRKSQKSSEIDLQIGVATLVKIDNVGVVKLLDEFGELITRIPLVTAFELSTLLKCSPDPNPEWCEFDQHYTHSKYGHNSGYGYGYGCGECYGYGTGDGAGSGERS